jgi:hypothetical protein
MIIESSETAIRNNGLSLFCHSGKIRGTSIKKMLNLEKGYLFSYHFKWLQSQATYFKNKERLTSHNTR